MLPEKQTVENYIIFDQPRLLIDDSVPEWCCITLKVGAMDTIYKFPGFNYNPMCKRWERKDDMKVVLKGVNLELEIFYKKYRQEAPIVVAEGAVPIAHLIRNPSEEVRIALLYDGRSIGWLYTGVKVNDQKKGNRLKQHFSISKISFQFLQDHLEHFRLRIYQNEQLIEERKFKLTQKLSQQQFKIKRAVRLSDLIVIDIQQQDNEVPSYLKVHFMIDNIKRGKTSVYSTWIRNRLRNKVGDLAIEYFLQNLFLQNDRKIQSRKAIIPQQIGTQQQQQQIQNQIQIQTQSHTQSQSQSQTPINTKSPSIDIKPKRRQVILKMIEQADKHIITINNSVAKIFKEISLNHRQKSQKKMKGKFQASSKTTGAQSKATSKDDIISIEASSTVKDKLKFYFSQKQNLL